ncbi:MAG: AAA family ATPase [Deltaproteobacteria bacterium]|nr:AAA family ATPase [Deltaproteobacteria bacterium]
MKELPVADLTFPKIIDQNLLYADKTRYIYDLLKGPKKDFFLSRPRRFGKTLLLYTLNELFTGNRGRFKGLWIDESDYNFPRLPVIFFSLSMDSSDPETLKKNIIAKLKRISEDYDIKLKSDSPDIFLGNLIRAIHKKSKTEVVVLIDEYDAPVTRNMAYPKIAQANAEVLHTFFASMKDVDVLPLIRFSFVTGITRYALTSMDSGPNHLADISLNPQYAGICGFTMDEFESLFSDRLETTLASLKDSHNMKPTDTKEDLKDAILRWYDGYNWGGRMRVLNPYSILNFFSEKSFNNYWIQSGQPRHLTAMIRAKPEDFIEPKLRSFLSTELRKSDLNQLSAVPVLFHSGYLTVDKVIQVEIETMDTKKSEIIDSYTFRLPNLEVSTSYLNVCFSSYFDLIDVKDLINKGEYLKNAILSRDDKTVSAIFSNFFSTITYYQRPASEKEFHTAVHLILVAMGFKLWSELAGTIGRMDLCVELDSQVFVIIELKYSPNKTKISPEKENDILSSLAMRLLPIDYVDSVLADVAMKMLKSHEIKQIIYKNRKKIKTEADQNKYLAMSALKLIPENDLNAALAEAAKKELPRSEIKKIIFDNSPKSDLAHEQIDDILKDAAQKALNDIAQRNYHGPLKEWAKEFIDLGLSIYGFGSDVKAIFGPIIT